VVAGEWCRPVIAQAPEAPVGNDNKAPWQGRDRTMKLKNAILGTSALAGVALLGATVSPAGAAEVLAGGALDITITGFARFEAFGGEVDDSDLDPDLSRSLDFRNDTEVHVLARAKSEETGMEYGGTIEFEADTNRTDNTDETWVFMSGGWGEVRLGDEDGVADNSVVGGQTIAAGTGGIDGSDAVISAAPVVFLTNTSDATKIRYYTPSFGGFSLGVDYTPTQTDLGSGANNGSSFAFKDGDLAMDAKNIVEGGLIYDGEFGGTAFLASVVGVYGELKNDAETLFGDEQWWGVQGGASVDLFGFKLAGSVATDNVGDTTRDFFTAGIGWGYGPLNTSVTYGQIFNTNADFDEATGIGDSAYNLVFSADIALAPGLVLAGDVSTFDNDTTEDFGTGDKGWTAVGSVRLAF
jgi:outer membrane protein OmpU